jgi:GTP cyclohydrolase I
MSRLVDILFQWREKPIGPHDLEVMLAEACARLEAPRARISLDFKYFITKQAPVSGCPSALDYDCRFVSETAPQGNVFTLGVEVPVTCLCPCSREISERGAHNQRAIIRVRLRSVGNEIIWIEDLVQRLEAHGSSPIYPLLKREDEKFVTEWAYDHPKFVEDVLRDVVVDLRADPHLAWFRVECESHESIHHHSVYARQEESRAPSGAFERPGEE